MRKRIAPDIRAEIEAGGDPQMPSRAAEFDAQIRAAERDGPQSDIERALAAITAKVLAHRPVDKGLAAKKTKRKLARKAKADD